ncbi:MAG TPA: hypothetical protein VJ723_10405, partial [Candidatus Angelobacter sp.]|nr:hypothetical protein [Candidatus Angelobacter sp.]
PEGPPGPSSGGPPFVWVCTPTAYNQLGNSQSNVYIFNGSGTTANVAAHFLNKDGTNLAGVAIPGASSPPLTYPGQTGSTTVTLASENTMFLPYQTPSGNPASGGDVLVTVTVTSDQPVAVSSDAQFDGPHPVPCSLLPK